MDIRRVFHKEGERHLSFLVPHGWRHSAALRDVRTFLEGIGVRVHERYWRALIAQIEVVSEELKDQVLIEAVRFWKRRFEFVQISPEERGLLGNWSRESYSAVRKLEKIVDQTKKLFDAKGFETELETSDIDSYAFYIKRDRSYRLWVGIWNDAPFPLSYGYHMTDPSWIKPVSAPASLIVVKKFLLWELKPETWSEPELIYATIDSALQTFEEQL